MANGAAGTTRGSGPASPPTYVDGPEARIIDSQVAVARRQVKLIDFASRVLLGVVGLIGFLLLVVLIDHWVFDLGAGGRWLALAALLAGVIWYVVRHLAWVAWRSINPLYAAKVIEQGTPALKNGLVNYLLLRQQRSLVQESVFRAIQGRTAADVEQLEVEAAIDHSPLFRIGYILAAVVALAGLYTIVSPKDPVPTVRRVLAPWAAISRPSRVRVLEFKPGDAQAFLGESVAITARLEGVTEKDSVAIIYSTDDGQTVERRVAMERGSDGREWKAMLPPDSAGLQQSLTYRLEAGDAITATYRLEARPAPLIAVRSVTYDYPAYTTRERRVVERQGDISAVEGTRVTVEAIANQPIKSAWIEFAPPGEDGADSAIAQLVDDSRNTPADRVLHLNVDGQTARQSFILQLAPGGKPKFAAYSVKFLTVEERRNARPVIHRIDVSPDFPPEVEFLAPTEDRIEMAADAELPIEVRAVDPDFGLRRAVLEVRVDGAVVLEHELFADPTGAPGQVVRSWRFSPKELGLRAGERATLQARAEDNRSVPPSFQPQPNIRRSRELIVDLGAASKPDSTPKAPGEKPTEESPNDPSPKPNRSPDNSKSPASSNPEKPSRDPQSPDPTSPDKPQSKDPQPDDKQPSGANSPRNKAGDSSAEKPSPDRSPQEKNPQEKAAQEKSAKEKPSQQPNSAEQPSPDKPSEDQKPSDKPSDSKKPDSKKPDNKKPEEKPTGDKPSKGEQSQEKQPSGKQSENKQSDGKQSDGKQSDGKQSDEKQNGGTQNSDKQSGGQPQSGSNSQGGEQPEKPEDMPGGGNPGESKPASGGQAKNESSKPSASGSQPANGAQPEGAAAGSPPSGAAGTTQPGTNDAAARDDENPAGGGTPSEKLDDGDIFDKALQHLQQQKQKPSAGGSGQVGGKEARAPEGGPSPTAEKPSTPPEGTGGKPNPADPMTKQQGAGSRNDTGTNDRAGGTPQGPPEAKADMPGAKPEGAEQSLNGEGKNGESGAGEAPREARVSPKSLKENEASKKTRQPDDSKPGEKTGPTSPSTSKKQSDSKNGVEGDKSGGGQQGGGQGANQKGNDSAGANSAADDGAGASSEAGEGDVSDKGGDKLKAAKPTGKPGTDKGSGSGTKPDAAGQATPDKPNGPPGHGGSPPDSPQSPMSAAPPSGQGGGSRATTGGGVASENAGPRSPQATGPVAEGDAANLDYARRATDLVLEYLKDQKDQPDPELLRRLGWSAEDLREFVARWQTLKQAANENNPNAQRELNETLRSLGLRPTEDRRRAAGAAADSQRGNRDAGGRSNPPAKYRDRFDAYRRGTSR
ncbi:MAG: hypothetical protein U1A77_24430 [Pirellulales bacterium]